VWVITQYGFYSTVAYDPSMDPKKSKRTQDLIGEGVELRLVRARDELDMKNLIALIPGDVEYVKTDRADYRFRTVLTLDEWTDFLAEESRQIDYRNFKNRVARTQGHERHDLLARVWGVLLELQPVGKYVWPKKARSSKDPRHDKRYEMLTEKEMQAVEREQLEERLKS
jgi:hypothetical protein